MDPELLADTVLSDDHRDFMQVIGKGLPILADLSRSDLMVYSPMSQGTALIVAHVLPRSIQPIHRESLERQRVSLAETTWALRALQGRKKRGLRGSSGGTTVVRDVLPIRHEGDLIGILSAESGILAYQRHRHRSKVFQRVVRSFQEMVLRGDLAGSENLSPFGENDGILVVDSASRIRYMSGIATNLYRRLGHSERLLNRRLPSVEGIDGALAQEAMDTRRCLEREAQRLQFTWVCKAIPQLARPAIPHWLPFVAHQDSNSQLSGAILTIHDATADRHQAQQMKVQAAMIQEIHHRVKNNLQIISSLLRIQSRRLGESEARSILDETIQRILSIAEVHDFLSHSDEATINIREVTQRIISQTIQGIGDPNKKISMEVSGPSVFLPAQQATACALVINELVQNALQHAFEERCEGSIRVTLQDNGEQISVNVHDDGEGLEADPDLMREGSLGLRIVQTLVQDDLGGTFELQNNNGVEALVMFPKTRMAR